MNSKLFGLSPTSKYGGGVVVFYIRLMLFWAPILFISGPARANTDSNVESSTESSKQPEGDAPSVEDWPQFKFEQSVRPLAPERVGRRMVGVLVESLDGAGFVYKRTHAPWRVIWMGVGYSFRKPVLSEDQKLSSAIGALEVDEKNRFQLKIGVDQSFRIFQSKYWNFLLGAGLGLRTSQYHTKYYPRICTLYCGHDRDRPIEDTTRDSFAFALTRIGFEVQDVRAAGLQADLVVALESVLVRAPQFADVSGPDGVSRDISDFAKGKLVFESSFELL